LYDSCKWDDKAIRKLIGDGKIASRSKGEEFQSADCNQECPICFLYYPEINVTKCCNANVCTECFLQVRPQKEKISSCPFCNSTKLSVTVAKKLSAIQLQEREKEEQRVIEAVIRSRSNSVNSPISKDKENKDNGAETKLSFGTSLEQDSRVALMRARSESFASSGSDNHNHRDEDRLIKSLAMTPEERRRLEEEMKAQLSHPLSLRVEAEAHQRRVENDRVHSRSNPTSSRAQRAAELFRSNSRYRDRRGGRDWNQIVDAFERGGNGEIQSLDDLVVLEAAILLSMDAESRQSPNIDAVPNTNFNAARHAGDGFPLVRSFFGNRNPEGGGGSATARRRLLNGGGLARAGSMGGMALDTAALLMRGISEEDQMAMAIAASMQEQQSVDNDDESEEDRSVHSSDATSRACDDEDVENNEDSVYVSDSDDEDDEDISGDGNDEERSFDSVDEDLRVESGCDDDGLDASSSISSNAEETNDDRRNLTTDEYDATVKCIVEEEISEERLGTEDSVE
jgi:hypothetical protein